MAKELFPVLFLNIILFGIYDSESGYNQKQKEGMFYTVMFWNLENYFDPFDDPATSDNEFTPFGERHWTWKKFVKKRNDISKVIISCGRKTGRNNQLTGASVEYPALVALAEVENRFVVDQLVRSTPLAPLEYGVIHRDSPDERGIDVALLYKKSLFRPLFVDWIEVTSVDAPFKTRLILYTKGVLEDLDTIHVFVNHWPSKFGGEAISYPKRAAAAKALKTRCDSILCKNLHANIILIGDFNDTPESSLFSLFDNFLNLSARISSSGGGTIRYKGIWELIDQCFISNNLLNKNEPICCDSASLKIYNKSFLLEKDKKYLGDKPKRSYIGPRYNGGISDHLPIILTIRKM